MAKNTTIKDIASRVGVSHVTVSHALRNSPLVKEQTRERIMQAAAEMGYQPNFAARSLINQSTQTLGLYVAPRPWAGLGHSYENRILIGIEQAAKQADYDLMLINLTGDDGGEVCVQKLAQRRVDGLMLINPDAQASWVTELAQFTKHVVMIDPASTNSIFRSVIFDNTQAVRLAIEHLVNLGHRRIGFLGSCLASPTKDNELRHASFIQVISEMGLQRNDAWIHQGFDPKQPLDQRDHYCQIEGIRGAKHMLTLPADQRPTALLAYNDLVAVHAVRHLIASHVLPSAMSVMGIDDSDWCFQVEPNITSVRHPLEQMGQAAVQWLVDDLSVGTVEKTAEKIKVFKPELIKRGSTSSWVKNG